MVTVIEPGEATIKYGLICGWLIFIIRSINELKLELLRILFLVADTQLYRRLCPSVGPLVRHGHRIKKWRNERFRYFLCILIYGGLGKGVDRGWMTLPTRTQRYCDPASLVFSETYSKSRQDLR